MRLPCRAIAFELGFLRGFKDVGFRNSGVSFHFRGF